jgi:hypothetical protein
MPVVAHELTHLLFNARPAAAQARLRERFDDSTDPMAKVGYGLLNESLATLMGNVVVGRVVSPDDTARRFADEGGLYNNRGIDRTTKALSGQADALLATTIDDDGFLPTYLRAVHTALGDAPAPSAYLHDDFIFAHTAQFESRGQYLSTKADANGFNSSELNSPQSLGELARNPSFTAVIMLSPRDLSAFDAYAASLGPPKLRAIHAEVRRGIPFVYAIPRGSRAMAFVLVAGDDASMNRMIDALLARETALEGVLRETRSNATSP